MRARTLLLLGLATAAMFVPARAASRLSFEERVDAQAAIERVSYSHQIGATLSFDEAVPRAVLEEKVRAYLRQSATLEHVWNTSITAEMLRREVERMAQASRMPDRLEELFAALGHDRFLIEECLARPILVERLLASFEGQSGVDAEAAFDAMDVPAVSEGGGPLPLRAAASCGTDDTWSNGTLDDVPDGRQVHTIVWTGSVAIVWGGISGAAPTRGGHRYDPATDTWSRISESGDPGTRASHSALWTGSEMIVWGGYDPTTSQALDTGARYHPLTDTWSPMSSTGAPTPRVGHTTAWTGSRMVVWGGTAFPNTPLDTGGRYDPATDTWAPISTTGAPSARSNHSMVWTGSRVVVWGGANLAVRLNTGGRYDPTTDTWTATSTTSAPVARSSHAAVWTGATMVVWGGETPSVLNTGGRYDPVADTWTATSTTSAPAARRSAAAVWSGSRMVVWGGVDAGAPINTGGRYDPVANSWTATSTTGAPTGRHAPTAVWTGTAMVVWGGTEQSGAYPNTGGRYDPVANTWTPTSVGGQPSGRSFHAAVWTGSKMIVWGGQTGSSTYVNTGSRYDPATDSWSATSTTGAPTARLGPGAVWTGSRMVVWGGYDGTAYPNTGGRYDPVANTWTATATAGGPAGRYLHSIVWTGSRVVVWGGFSGSPVNTGGRYDPVANTWSPVTTTGEPGGRYLHTTVWTGTRMIVWGGQGVNGGQYDPAADAWTPVASFDGPDHREEATAVWTGSEMIVWGGTSSSLDQVDRGGRYDPESNTWTATSMVGAPAARASHVAVWTGSRMVVWGGFQGFPTTVWRDTGGRYDPFTDTWTPTAMASAPIARRYFTAVWTGTEMIPWGGSTNPGSLASGGRYTVNVDDDGDTYTICGGDCDDRNAGAHPGGVEVCNGADDDCDGPSDEGIVAPSGRPEVIEAKSGSDALLSWSAVSGVTGYDTVTGSLALLLGSGGDFTSSTAACLANDVASTSAVDSSAPAPGDATWHLVRAVNACGGNGTYDDPVGGNQVAPRDAGIGAAGGACP